MPDWRPGGALWSLITRARPAEWQMRAARSREESVMPHTSDTRILGYEPLLSPAALLEELPLGPAEA